MILSLFDITLMLALIKQAINCLGLGQDLASLIYSWYTVVSYQQTINNLSKYLPFWKLIQSGKIIEIRSCSSRKHCYSGLSGPCRHASARSIQEYPLGRRVYYCDYHFRSIYKDLPNFTFIKQI